VSLFRRRNAVRRLNPSTPYESLLMASMFYVIAVLIANASALLPSAGLDFVAIFGWLAPLLCADPLERFAGYKDATSSLSPEKKNAGPLVAAEPLGRQPIRVPTKQAILCVVIASLVLGTASVVNYYRLEPRTGEIVGAQEVAAAEWLGRSHFVVVSDLHFLSTYIAIDGGKALHFLPLDRGSIESTFYSVNLTFVQSHGANAFVVTGIMESGYISNFDGTRTIANPRLTDEIGSRWSRVYDNGADQIYAK